MEMMLGQSRRASGCAEKGKDAVEIDEPLRPPQNGESGLRRKDGQEMPAQTDALPQPPRPLYQKRYVDRSWAPVAVDESTCIPDCLRMLWHCCFRREYSVAGVDFPRELSPQ